MAKTRDKNIPTIPRAPGMPRVRMRISSGLPAYRPKVPDVPTVEPTDQPEPVTEAEFTKRYQDWGQGTKAEFAAFDYLSNRQHLLPYQDFWFLPSGYAGGLSKFYVGGMVWRITGEKTILNSAANALERAQFEHNGYTVVDLNATALEQDRENVLGSAWHGRGYG